MAALLVAGGLVFLGEWWVRTGGDHPAGLGCAAQALSSLPQEVGSEEVAVRAAMQMALDGWAAEHAAAASLHLGRIWGQGSWAAGEVQVRPAGPGSSEGTLVLARRSGASWEVALAGQPTFRQLLEEGPARFLPPGATDWFRAQSAPLVSDTQGLYYLPYTKGTSLRVSCVDCYAGHAPAVDFYSWGDRTLRAARTGAVAAWRDVGDFCCCQSGCSACGTYLVLDHGDGEYSAYLHLASGSIPEPYRHVGALVARGAAIGQEGDVGYTCGSSRQEVGCGPVAPTPGQKCGRHLHFEVRDAPYPYGQRLRPRFQDVYDQTNPHTYYVEQYKIYVSGNLWEAPVSTYLPVVLRGLRPPTPAPTPTPTAVPAPTPTPTPAPQAGRRPVRPGLPQI